MKIAMYDLEGHLLEVFENVDSVLQFEKDMGFSMNQINHCVNGLQLQAKNRQFRKHSDNYTPHNKIGDVSNLNRWGSKSIHKYYNKKYICSYKSVIEASEKNNLHPDIISNCCNNRQKTAGGFEWKYAQ